MVTNEFLTRGRELRSPAQLVGYDSDGLGYKSFPPDLVLIPADADELIEVVQRLRSVDRPYVVRGAGTSLSGGPVAAQGGVVIHTSGLRAIRRLEPSDLWCEVECGVTLKQLEEALRPHGLFYPPDPSSGLVCTIGGNVAMNAGGARCFRFGVTSNYVLGVEMVGVDGVVRRFGGPGGGRGPWREDWTRLMVGSEGTLGTIIRVWLRVSPLPEKSWTFRAPYARLEDAEKAIHALVTHSSRPTAIELMDPRCVAMVENSPMRVGLPGNCFLILTEIDGPANLVDGRVESVAQLLRDAGSDEVQYSDDEQRRIELWKARKVAGGLMGQMSPDFLVQDAVIPKRALADVLNFVYEEADAAGLPVVNVFHAGDGNLHPNFLFDSRRPGELAKVERISKRFMGRVIEVDGTLSGEHGIGNDKANYTHLFFDNDAARIQMAVTEAFNPQHQMNPLKVFPERRYAGVIDESRGEPSKTKPRPRAEDRLFGDIVDLVDGVLCVPADCTGLELRTKLVGSGWRFPLEFALDKTLCEWIVASEYPPASARFGPFRDNVIGMNWKLPSGRVIRIGERVVKSTTGYDYMKFLLHTEGDFGAPVDYVLRLRGDAEQTFAAVLEGASECVYSAFLRLSQSCWTHWFDSVDLIQNREQGQLQLRVCARCNEVDAAAMAQTLKEVAERDQLAIHIRLKSESEVDSLPDLVIKTTLNDGKSLAESLCTQPDVDHVIMGLSGAISVYLASAVAETECSTRVRRLCSQIQSTVESSGGTVRSRWTALGQVADGERPWIEILERRFAE